ncbi:hypothetical protein LTR16_000253 [Cryomyces antarcticus]|uniref:ribonuclease H n=1 Tax=Cryomyces antarcticus TaxID=329879 RepID=A0ABR0M1Q5_9PEZI|nr:hypothetical protein LTR39_000132 [Cryomyces antarcticus]KAK5021308.1 hypothetical protein LTR60_000045 [Cryomyces antarcticus]KAK5257568.1 hypothetical protein LTR16_000253 [Cryomyces antarcticus]
MPAARVFHDQGATPRELFPPGTSRCVFYRTRATVHRYIARFDAKRLLIFTDGACSNNGSYDARGGCVVSFALEDTGPTGEAHAHTSNRAELRAVIAALQYRTWSKERFQSLVIATDSEYVVKGATVWSDRWMRNGWRLSNGENVRNQDLWELLLDVISTQKEYGLNVEFWRIPRGLNMKADSLAKTAAAQSPRQLYFTELEHEDE